MGVSRCAATTVRLSSDKPQQASSKLDPVSIPRLGVAAYTDTCISPDY
jgi:hypothetical protein